MVFFCVSTKGPYGTISFEHPYKAIVADVSDVAPWASCDNSYSLFDKENCSEDGKVLMRKKSSKVGKDGTKTNHMVSDSCQTGAVPTIGRPVEVVSDIFHFLTETEAEREIGIPRPGNEDKIFNKLLIIDETHGTCNTDGPNIESVKNSPKPQGNVTDQSMENSEDSSDDDTGN